MKITEHKIVKIEVDTQELFVEVDSLPELMRTLQNICDQEGIEWTAEEEVFDPSTLAAPSTYPGGYVTVYPTGGGTVTLGSTTTTYESPITSATDTITIGTRAPKPMTTMSLEETYEAMRDKYEYVKE